MSIRPSRLEGIESGQVRIDPRLELGPRPNQFFILC